MECSGCGHTNADSAKFCNECGTRLSERTGAERRQVTVLFCDLVESTQLSQRLDPEDLREVVQAFQNAATEAIARYEGHVAQYLGDGILVYFGYPVAHENEAERAIRAGLDVLDDLQRLNRTLDERFAVRLEARIGIHTGSAVVGEIGSGDKRETLAMGDASNIASRLQEIATPNSVFVSQATHRLASRRLRAEPLGERTLKGIAAPVAVFRVLEISALPESADASRGGADRTPLVGRDQEIGMLLDRWERAAEGEGQTVLVSGEAGVGKSRLLREFRSRIDHAGSLWLECHGNALTQGSPFSAVADLIHRGLGLAVGASDEDKQAALEQALNAVGLPLQPTASLLAPLLSLRPGRGLPPLTPDLQRKRTIEALVAWLLALADRRPLALVIEDLHWCDPSSLEFLDAVVAQCPAAPLLAIATHRPEYAPPSPERAAVSRLRIPRLRTRQAERIVRAVADGRGLEEEIVAEIVARSDGVPLFLEELTSSIVEANDGDAVVPSTLQDSLMARLDRLGTAKEVAQAASVLGRRFPFALLEAVVAIERTDLDAGLAQLETSGLLSRRGSGANAVFAFKHALIQDVAYQSMLRRTRRELHARAGRALEERFPEWCSVDPEVAARHFDTAGMGSEAIAHYQRAAKLAVRRSANAEALGHLRRALELLSGVDPKIRDQTELQLQVAIGAPLFLTLGWGHPEYRESTDRAHELASTVPDTPPVVRFNALMGKAGRELLTGEFDAAEQSTDLALELAERIREEGAFLAAYDVNAQAKYFRGDFASAMETISRAVALYEPTQHGPLAFRVGTDHGLYAGAYRCSALWKLGYPDQALRQAERTLATARELSHPFSLGSVLLITCFVYERCGEIEQARACADEGHQIFKELGQSVYLPWSICLRAHLGRVPRDQAAGVIADQTASMKREGIKTRLCSIALYEAAALRETGRPREALAALHRGLALADETGNHFETSEIYRALGDCHAELGEPAAAGDWLRRALRLAQEQQARSFELRAAISLADLCRNQGDSDAGYALVRPVFDWFEEGLGTQDLISARELLNALR